MKRIAQFIIALLLTITISGCGETVSGIGKDVSRMGRGVSTFFFRQ